jgi:hypothetical protein
MAENQVYLIKSGQNSFVEETEAIIGISGGRLGVGTTTPEADLHVTGSVKIGGDLAVDGTFTTINSSTISVDDKNIELGSTDSPTDITADGGGITVKGATDKTFNWIDATDAWTSSEHLHLAAGKRFAADGIRALGANGLNIGDDAGNGIFVQDGGKVGIATTNPGYDLDVDGSGNFASLYVDGNAVLTGEGSIFGKWEDGAAQGEIFYTGGNVGVGTNNPEYPLHVVGNSVVHGNFVVNGTSGNFNVSDFNVSGDSIVLNYGGGSLTSNRGGIIVKDSSFADKTFEYVEGSDYWNSNVGLNITNGGINAASVSAVDANGLTLGDDAGNGIFVEDGGQIGINTTSPSYNLHVNGSTHVGGEFSVSNEFKISAGGAIGGTAPASDGDIIKWDDANSKWVAGANVGGGGGGGVGEVPLATINSLPSGQSIYEIEFAETYNVEPRIATQLEIDGEGSIIPYVVSGVSTSGYHLIFAQDIPNNNYRIHTTFGGRDVHWETGSSASLYYNDGDVSIQRNFTIGGNLTVNGTTTTVNTETVEIEDHNLVIAANTGYNQLDSQYPAGGAYAGILWGTGDAGAASPVSLTYQTNKGFSFEGGNVGIGTTSPGHKLDVVGGNVRVGKTSNGQFIGENNSGIQTIKLDTDGNSFLKGGNVGIGTTNPGAKLDIHAATNTNGLLIREDTDNSITHNFYVDNADNGAVILYADGQSPEIKLNTAGDSYINGGNVGIGTTNPRSELNVAANNSGQGAILTLENSDTSITADDVIGQIDFYANDGSENGTGAKLNIKGIAESAAGTLTALTFGTSDSTSDTAIERMRIDSTGNVGIGTTNPARLLHLKNSNSTIAFETPIDANGSAFAQIKSGRDGSSGYSSTLEFATTESTTAVPTFGSNGTGGSGFVTRMLIDSSGNVGIGTTNPNYKLDIQTTDSYLSQNLKINRSSSPDNHIDLAFQLWGGAGTGQHVFGDENYTSRPSAVIRAKSVDSTAKGDLIFATFSGGANNSTLTEKMRIRYNGNVGIGATSPGQKLVVESDKADWATKLINTNASPSGLAIQFAADIANASNDFIRCFKNSSDVRFRVYSNGTVLANATEYTSDDRVKHNEQAIVGAIETLGKLAPKKYIKTADMYEADHDFELDADGNPVDEDGEPVEHSVEAGVIAQQVLEVPELAFIVSPEGVDEDGNVTSPHGLNYNSLFTYAIAAIQEQQSIIESLQSQNASLESRISALES